MSDTTDHRGPMRTSEVLSVELEAIFGGDAVRELNRAMAAGGNEEDRLEQVQIAARQLGPVALCLSGGGIRSAAFALGVVQGLAKAGLLTRFHYLSTVSGGGYIGSWLSAWLHWAGGSRPVIEGLIARGIGDVEPAPIQHLRQFSNYLTPRLGVMSSDTWAAVAIYGRNLLLNWTILFPALWLLVLFPKIASAAVQLARANPLPELFTYLFAALISVLVICSSWYTTANRVSGQSRCLFHMNAQSSFLFADLLPLVLAGTAFTWVVNRPLQYVGWLTQNYWGLALVAFGAAALYLAGFLLARLTYRPEQDRNRHPPVQWLRDGAAWLFSGLIAGKVLWFGATGYVALPDLMTVVPAHCIADQAACAAGEAGTMTEAIKLDAKSLLVIVGMPYFLVAVMAGQLLFVLLRSYSPRGDIEREWLGRAAGWYIAVALAWMIGGTLVLFASAAAAGVGLIGEDLQGWLAPLGGVSGALAALLGKSSLTSPARDRKENWQATLINIALGIAGAVFGAVIVISSSILIDNIVFGQPLQETLLFRFRRDPAEVVTPALISAYREQWAVLLSYTGGLLLVWLLLGWFVNPNRFSLHALYRNRLIRAFLGGPHLAAADPEQRRRPNLFTGFDNADNIRCSSLWPPPVTPRGGERDWRPFHVINMALNVVSGRNLAWQQRKAEPFVVTPLASGSHGPGYRPTREYGNRGDRGISLGTAMAISGAAASPNMGYHSSPMVTLLLAVLNVRLGWWLGNPGRAGQRTYGRDGPNLAFGPFFAELFGLTTDNRPYVYLSDGGHFENLGIYEMVRRRCAVIVVSDAGQDGTYDFADLGNAVRKIRIDLGIDIELPPLSAFQRPDPMVAGWQRPIHLIGTIRYPEPGAVPGRLFYLKPGLQGGEPADIVAYAHANRAFPHQSTNDQWFDEPQFESYRALGHHTMSAVMEELQALMRELPA